MKQLPLVSFFPFTYMKYHHNKVSGLVSFLLFRSFVSLKLSTLVLLKAFIVKTSFKNTFGAVKTIMSNIS